MTPRTPILILATAMLSMSPVATWAANPPQQEDEARLNRARMLYDRAVTLSYQNKHEEALSLIQEAWTLKKHCQTAAVLAMEELHAKQFAKAAQHDAWALRFWDHTTDPDQLVDTQKFYAKAKAEVTTAMLRGVQPSATVLVDNEPRDATYAPDPVFLDVGPHTIEVRLPDGSSKKRALTAEAGKTVELDMSPDPVAKPSSSVVPTAPPSAAPPPPSYELTSRGWSPRTWTLVTEGSLAAVALGVGIGFALHASSLQSDAQSAGNALGPYNACETPNEPCSNLARSYDDRATAARWANIGLVTGGALGIATVATFFLWPSSHAAPKGGTGYSISPTVGDSNGLTLHGAF